MRHHGIDNDVIDCDGRKFLRNGTAGFDEKAVRNLEYISFVDNGDMFASRQSQFESCARNPLAAKTCYPPQRNGDILGHQHLAATCFHVPIRIKALGVLTRDYEIELAAAQRKTSIGPRRSNI